VTLSEREIAGHPAGLYVLFFTEMWERFCYYGMRALLTLYVWKHLSQPEVFGHVIAYAPVRHAIEAIYGAQSDKQLAYQVYGAYTALTYLTPLLGGILADRLIGQRKSVVIGGIVMAIGEFMLMSDALFYPGITVLIIGNGFFKSNISTQVGALYPPGDPRRDRAFNIFYVGINLGAFLSPFVCGTLGERVGWSWGFGSAGVGMLLGLAIYLGGQRYLAPDQIMQKKAADEPTGPTVRGTAGPPDTPHARFTRSEWARIVALVALCALNISFWGVYEQQGDSLQVWVDSSSERHVLRWFGSEWEMPATWFQALNPMFIFVCTPFINVLWERQYEKKTEPSSVAKMAIGCFLLGISFLIMIGAGRVVESGQLAGMNWLVGCSFLLTIGEIYLSPVGLSLVTKISPPRIVSMMMGMWFLSSFFGNYASGVLATFDERMSKSAFFLMLAGISLATGVLMIVLYRPLQRAIGDENRA
jgi:POT family proton-dependent oligopeptide transporter